jgi:hypothetical protein
MRKMISWLSLVAILAFPICFIGCGGSAPLPGASSPSSEEADAMGGMNKEGAAEAQTPAEEGKAPADEGKAPASEDKPADEPKSEGKTG